jgi:ribosomal protein S18 acetylase RimI-like enzyme
MSVIVRSAVLPRDIAGIAALDTRFTTTEVYDVAVVDEEIRLSLRSLDAPLTKRFPLGDLDDAGRPYDQAWVAVEDAEIVGFAATSYASWNRRLVLWHLYVDPARRRRGIARELLDAVDAHALARGARNVWLETSSLNAPGVAAYRSLGFTLSGADLTLYDGTAAQGETALFFSRSVR